LARRYRWLIVGAALLLGLWLYPRPLLYPLGAFLVRDDGAVKCDCLFVLAGDFRGERILHAAELYKQGYAAKIFVSGPEGIFRYTEDTLAIEFARDSGSPDVPFVGIPNNGRSTVTEGRAVLSRLRAEGCKSVLVVTSNFHTRRAGNILRRVWPEIDVRMAAAPSADFDVNRWWTDRNHQKTLFFEWTKTVADWIGL